MSTTSVSGLTCCSARKSSRPLVPGIMRSVSTTSTLCLRTSSSALFAPSAQSTRKPSRWKIFCSDAALLASSSTTSTVGASRAGGSRRARRGALPCVCDSGASGASGAYRMSFERLLKASVPARPSQSKTTVSVVVSVAPAARQSSSPWARWSSRREATPSMGTCTSSPRAARLAHRLKHADVRLHAHHHHRASPARAKRRSEAGLVARAEGELLVRRDAERGEALGERPERAPEPLRVLLGGEHAHAELSRGLEREGRRAHELAELRLGHGGGEALLHVDDDEERALGVESSHGRVVSRARLGVGARARGPRARGAGVRGRGAGARCATRAAGESSRGSGRGRCADRSARGPCPPRRRRGPRARPAAPSSTARDPLA
jgi:hypothetical protein